MNNILYFIEQHKEPIEQWKEIKGTSGKYFISSFGRVISGAGEKPCFLSPWLDSTNDYYRISIYINGRLEKPYIHRLVAEYFTEQRTEEKRLVVHHKDYNKHNNRMENLVYLTDKEHHKIHHSKGMADNGKES